MANPVKFSGILVEASRPLKNQHSSVERKQSNSQQGIILEPRTEIEEEEKDHCSQPMMASNQLFGISYHLENHLLVKANDFNKDNTCNENPEEELSVDVLDKDGSSCMGTLQPEINPKKQPLLPIQEEQQLHFAKMDSSLSSNSQMRSGTEASGSTRFALRTRKQTKDLLQSQASPQLL